MIIYQELYHAFHSAQWHKAPTTDQAVCSPSRLCLLLSFFLCCWWPSWCLPKRGTPALSQVWGSLGFSTSHMHRRFQTLSPRAYWSTEPLKLKEQSNVGALMIGVDFFFLGGGSLLYLKYNIPQTLLKLLRPLQ